ncbi:hypothetical protein [Sulfitobacter sp. THAF37]|uniref:hypothetical protein n=1 Tax=Sulfitobacter sp. THAF37 TaxID=2587855 RepID=UPI0015625DE5|nr:hypothetical protein [Sulfitobacter sp. THAF37]
MSEFTSERVVVAAGGLRASDIMWTGCARSGARGGADTLTAPPPSMMRAIRPDARDQA